MGTWWASLDKHAEWTSISPMLCCPRNMQTLKLHTPTVDKYSRDITEKIFACRSNVFLSVQVETTRSITQEIPLHLLLNIQRIHYPPLACALFFLGLSKSGIFWSHHVRKFLPSSLIGLTVNRLCHEFLTHSMCSRSRNRMTASRSIHQNNAGNDITSPGP